MLTAAQTAASVSEKKKTYSPRKSAPPKTTVTSYREAVSPTEEEKIKAGAGLANVSPTIYTEPSGRPVQSSEEAVISGTVSPEQRAAEKAATFAFYKGESQTEVQRSATDAYRKSLGLPPLEASTPFSTKIVAGGSVFGSDVYDPQYASLSDRATTEHVMALADELGMPDKQPKTNAEKAEAMALRKELVAKLESEGIDSGLAWSLARQASYNKYEPSRFKKLYGVDVGTSLKPFESERIMDELKALKSNLSFKSGALADRWQSIQDKYKSMGDFRGGRGLTQAPISGGLEPGYRSPDSVMSEQLRDQYQLFSAQSTYLGRYIKRAESGKRVTINDAMKSIIAPESLLPKLQGTSRATYAGKGIPGSGVPGRVITEVTEPVQVDMVPVPPTMRGGCRGGACLAPNIMAQAAVNSFANVQAKGVTRTTTPSVYQGIAGSDVDVYGNTLVAGVVKKDSDYFKGATATGVVHRPGGASDTGNLFSGAFAYGQGAYAGRGGFHEFVREFLTGGSVVTSLRNRPMLEQEFAEHSSFDKKAALGNARQALEIEWARNQLSPIDQKEKATWLKTVGYEYDLAAADARVQGQYLDESKDEFLARVSKEYDTGVRDYYNSPANREAWVQENLADYNKQLDEKAASGRIELYDDSGNLVFRGDKEQYINYRLASEPSTGSLARSYGISMIPVYGTIQYGREAAKGGWTGSEIGWMSLSAGADIAMIVPPIGAAARAGTAAKAGLVTSRGLGASRIAIVARNIRAITPSLKIARPTVKGIAIGLGKTAKEYWKSLKYPFTTRPSVTFSGLRVAGSYMTGGTTLPAIALRLAPYQFPKYAYRPGHYGKPIVTEPTPKPTLGDVPANKPRTVVLGDVPYGSPKTGVLGDVPYSLPKETLYTTRFTGGTIVLPQPDLILDVDAPLSPTSRLMVKEKVRVKMPNQTIRVAEKVAVEPKPKVTLDDIPYTKLSGKYNPAVSVEELAWAREFAKMTPEQVFRVLGTTSPLVWAVSSTSSLPLITRIAQASITTTSPLSISSEKSTVYPRTTIGILPFSGISPIPSTAASSFPSVQTVVSVPPITIPATIPTLSIPTPKLKPVTPKPVIPEPDIPIPIIPPSWPGFSGGAVIVGGEEGIQDLGYWEFGDMYAGVHPLTGKLVTVRAKKRIRYGDVPRTVYRSKVIRSKISGSTNSDTPFYKEEYAA